MIRLIAAVANLSIVASLGLSCASAAAQQMPRANDAAAPQFLGPAMNLEDVRVAPGAPRLTVVGPEGTVAHGFPTVETARALLRLNPAGPLAYHRGPIMQSVTIHRIFWVPKTLQTGAPTGMSNSYIGVLSNLTVDYPAHGIDNNNTQYYQIANNTVTYAANAGVAPVGWIDNTPYPASGCFDRLTPGNCLSDAQMRAEIQKIRSQRGWAAGLDTLFVLFTSSGEGSCNGVNSCAYADYCAYHAFVGGATPVVYAAVPYGNVAFCAMPGTPSPNHDPVTDAAASALTHEISEAITDPLLNAWFGTEGAGSEIGDLCAYKYGVNSWDFGFANQMWNGHFYELQMEYDNHLGTCVQIGP